MSKPGDELRAAIDKSVRGISETKIKTGEIIFRQSQPADFIYYLRSGRVKMTTTSSAGREAMVGMVEPGKFFGESCLDNTPIWPQTATAMIPSGLIAIPKEQMHHLLATNPHLSKLFLSFLLERMSRIEDNLIDQLFHSTEERLARLLLTLAPDRTVVPKEINQEMMAEMIGTTRQHVNHFMTKFRKTGCIRYTVDGKLHINAGLLAKVLRDGENR